MKYFYVGLLLLFIQGCMHSGVSESTWRKMTPLASCKQQCFIRQQSCQRTCENSCQSCQKKAKIEALCRYDDYIVLQRRQGKVVARERNAFLDPLACIKWTCNCTQDYEVCKAECQGQVRPFMVNPGCDLSSPPNVIWWWPATAVKG